MKFLILIISVHLIFQGVHHWLLKFLNFHLLILILIIQNLYQTILFLPYLNHFLFFFLMQLFLSILQFFLYIFTCKFQNPKIVLRSNFHLIKSLNQLFFWIHSNVYCLIRSLNLFSILQLLVKINSNFKYLLLYLMQHLIFYLNLWLL